MKTHLSAMGILALGVLALAGTARVEGIQHRVMVGSSDIDAAGAASNDADFSLVARVDWKGNVEGQWRDRLGPAGGSSRTGVQIDVTNLAVYGNIAVIGGIVRVSSSPFYAVGDVVCTLAQDDDVSGDRIAPTFRQPFEACNGVARNATAFTFPVRGGQVKVQ